MVSELSRVNRSMAPSRRHTGDLFHVQTVKAHDVIQLSSLVLIVDGSKADSTEFQ